MYGQLAKDELLVFRLVDIIFASVAEQNLGLKKTVEMIDSLKGEEEILLERTNRVQVNTNDPKTGQRLSFIVFKNPRTVNLKGHYLKRASFVRIPSVRL